MTSLNIVSLTTGKVTNIKADKLEMDNDELELLSNESRKETEANLNQLNSQIDKQITTKKEYSELPVPVQIIWDMTNNYENLEGSSEENNDDEIIEVVNLPSNPNNGKYITIEDCHKLISQLREEFEEQLDELECKIYELKNSCPSPSTTSSTVKQSKVKSTEKAKYKASVRSDLDSPFEVVGIYKNFREMAPHINISHTTASKIFKGLPTRKSDLIKIEKV